MRDNTKLAVFKEYKNKKGLSVCLCSYGAGIYYIKINEDYMTFSPVDKENWLSTGSYFGKSVGPICGRIKDGLIVSNYGNKQLKMMEGDGNVILHSEDFGIGYRNFKVKEVKNEDSLDVIFYLDYVDDVNDGFFDAYIEMKYRIFDNENKILLTQLVTPKGNCYYSLTNHAYFSVSKNLVTEQLLKIDADRVCNLDEKLLLNQWDKVNEIFDFRVAHKVGDHINEFYPKRANGYDHPWNLLSHKDAITLEGEKYKLHISTSYDGVVCYSNCWENKGEEILGRGENKRFDAIAIEPQSEPFNMEKMYIRGGETRINYIEYYFEIKE